MSYNCPLCGSDNCRVKAAPEFNYMVSCKNFSFKFLIEQETLSMWQHQTDVFSKIIVSIILFLNEHPYWKDNHNWRFYYEETETLSDEDHSINVYSLLKDYPRNAIERLEKALLNIGKKYPNLGDTIHLNTLDYPLFYIDTNHLLEDFSHLNLTSPIKRCYAILSEMGYISSTQENTHFVTAEGWKRIGELLKKKDEINQGFIAMWFSPKTDSISEAFIDAISQCGYSVCRMDTLHHNGQIVPEMLYQISRSKFLVVDVTYANLGAYYEAGYAEALGKEVIVCCKRSVLESADRKEKPHFDIAQKSMVIWNDENELVQRLQERIEATVGKNL